MFDSWCSLVAVRVLMCSFGFPPQSSPGTYTCWAALCTMLGDLIEDWRTTAEVRWCHAVDRDIDIDINIEIWLNGWSIAAKDALGLRGIALAWMTMELHGICTSMDCTGFYQPGLHWGWEISDWGAEKYCNELDWISIGLDSAPYMQLDAYGAVRTISWGLCIVRFCSAI